MLLFAGFWLNRILERAKSDLAAARDRQQRISDAQFKLYTEVWSNLQDLKTAGDRLWERCTPQTLSPFVTALVAAGLAIDRGRLILTKTHYDRLQQILRIFENFRLGKTRLIDLQSRQDFEHNPENDFMGDLSNQVQSNRQHKQAYEELLLNEILPEFRQQLQISA